jgi:RNA polymerase sigma-70 factor (ECF subfamily)
MLDIIEMSMNKLLTDQELVARALQDKNEFAAIVERYQAAIRRYIIRLGCINDDDADDLLQDIFLKVYVNLNDYEQDLKFSSWLYRIAHNEVKSFFRKKRTRPALINSEDKELLLENMSYDTHIRDESQRANYTVLIAKAIAQLTPAQREALILKFFEEKSYNEISDIMKIPMGTVATLIGRGKKKLKKLLS